MKFGFTIYLFAYTDSATMSMEKVTFKRAGSLYHRYFVCFYHQVKLTYFGGRRLTA